MVVLVIVSTFESEVYFHAVSAKNPVTDLFCVGSIQVPPGVTVPQFDIALADMIPTLAHFLNDHYNGFLDNQSASCYDMIYDNVTVNHVSSEAKWLAMNEAVCAMDNSISSVRLELCCNGALPLCSLTCVPNEKAKWCSLVVPKVSVHPN